MTIIILNLIHLYQKTLSRLFQYINPYQGCRFYPSCSQYCYRAIKKYGIFRGLIKTIIRISKCHPFNKGGYDPC